MSVEGGGFGSNQDDSMPGAPTLLESEAPGGCYSDPTVYDKAYSPPWQKSQKGDRNPDKTGNEYHKENSLPPSVPSQVDDLFNL